MPSTTTASESLNAFSASPLVNLRGPTTLPLRGRLFSVEVSTSPLSSCTLHLPQVPRPPQVESMGSPIQWAALKSVVPLGTLVVRPKGW